MRQQRGDILMWRVRAILRGRFAEAALVVGNDPIIGRERRDLLIPHAVVRHISMDEQDRLPLACNLIIESPAWNLYITCRRVCLSVCHEAIRAFPCESGPCAALAIIVLLP